MYLILELKGVWVRVKLEIRDNTIENGQIFVYCGIVEEFDRVAVSASRVLLINHEFISW
jgi:hypothetical protein